MRVSWRRIWLAAFVFWMTVGLFAASQNYLSGVVEGNPSSVVATLSLTLPTWLYWALVTPPIVWLARRVRLENAGWARFLGVHMMASLLVIAGRLAIITAALLISGWQPPPAFGLTRAIQLVLLSRIVPDTLVYLTILGASYALDYYTRYRDRELEASRLESRLAEARLASLRMQLNPHFMFNTLNTVASQIRTGRGTVALRMLDTLGELLRHALDGASRQEVPLEEDLRFVRNYLDIESLRFGDRLSVGVDVDPAIRRALVPALLLQPLVENSIRHGITPRPAGGSVTIAAHREGGDVRITVRDDGIGVKEADLAGPDAGVGLSNARARLESLYGAAGRLSVLPGDPSGTVVRVEIPFREALDE